MTTCSVSLRPPHKAMVGTRTYGNAEYGAGLDQRWIERKMQKVFVEIMPCQPAAGQLRRAVLDQRIQNYFSGT